MTSWGRRKRRATRWLRDHGRDAVVIGSAVVATGVLSVLAFQQPDAPDGPGAPLPEPTLKPATPAYPPLPAHPKMLVVGDSYTQGSGAETESQGYAHLLDDRLGWETRIDGIAGSGFIADPPYVPRLREDAEGGYTPDVVLIEGGQNDSPYSPAKVASAVERTVNTAQRQWPDARVIVFGPMAPLPLADALRPGGDNILNAAGMAGAQTIDPLGEDWITPANTDRYGYPDGAHLSTAGHRYVAGKVAAALRRLTR